MKKLYYDEGPLVMGCGIAGQFRLGVPKDVPDDLAALLLAKGRLKEWKEPAPARSRTSVAEAAQTTAAAEEGKKEV